MMAIEYNNNIQGTSINECSLSMPYLPYRGKFLISLWFSIIKFNCEKNSLCVVSIKP